jgi:protein-tyrosine phosphatase
MSAPRPVTYAIPAPFPARLSIMARPTGAGQLDAELRGLRASGAEVLVCLLTSDERERAGLADEPDAAERAGLEFHALPVTDFGVPDPRTAVPLLDALAGALAAGRHVVVHCWGGIGRSSLIAAALLVRLGTPPDQAWETIAVARGCAVPETEAQRHWLDSSAL